MNSNLFRRIRAGGFISITPSADSKAGGVDHGLPLSASSIPSHDSINILAHTAGFSQLMHIVKQYKDAVDAASASAWSQVVSRICNQTTEIFDPYRRQLLIDRGLSLGKIVHKVLSEYLAINGILKADGNRFKLGNIVLLKSMPHANAKPQAFHRDGRMSVIVALQDKTTLLCEFSDGTQKKITCQQGQLLIFGKHFKHAGAAYKETNIRLHVFLDASSEDHGAGVTHDMNDCPADDTIDEFDSTCNGVSFFLPQAVVLGAHFIKFNSSFVMLSIYTTNQMTP